MDKKECKIIQDLLPNHIDNLTTPETNEFIENHLKQCSECTKIFENMKKDFGIEEKPEKKNFKTFMKKYRNKLRIFKIIVLAIIVIFLVALDRKAMIMIGLNAKANTVKNKTAYNMRFSLYNEVEVLRVQVYRRDKEYTRELRHSSLIYDDDVIIREYPNGETSNYYIKNGDSKQAILNADPEGIVPIKLEDFYFRANSDFLGFIRNVLCSSIRREKFNSSSYSYYFISNINLPDIGLCDIYVEKDTGFIARILLKGETDYFGWSGNLIDVAHGNLQLFEEPDISEYEIIEEQTPENTRIRR